MSVFADPRAHHATRVAPDLIEMTARVAFDETVAEVNGAMVTTQEKRSEAERDEQESTPRTTPSGRQALTSPSRWAYTYFMQHQQDEFTSLTFRKLRATFGARV